MKLLRSFCCVVLAVVCVLVYGQLGAAELSSINLRPGVTEVSRSVYGLHMYVFWVCVAIGVVVYGVLIYSIFRHRKSKGVKAATFSHSTVMEIIWTAIPVVILVLLVVPAVEVMEEMYDASDPEVNILVTGYQWKWKYDYLDYDHSFFSNLATSQEAIYQNAEKGENYLLEVDNELILPINRKVRFLVTANDVLHSWWVPDFAVKRDAIPGYINETWAEIEEIGVYRGQCAELCGKDHAYMPIVVRAVSQSDFDSWIAKQASKSKIVDDYDDLPSDELISSGKSIYEVNCVACHQATGQGSPPVFPALSGNALVADSDPTEVINSVYFGRKGTAMQAFGEQLNIREVASVISYIRNSWGNEAPLVQPGILKEKIAQ